MSQPAAPTKLPEIIPNTYSVTSKYHVSSSRRIKGAQRQINKLTFSTRKCCAHAWDVEPNSIQFSRNFKDVVLICKTTNII